MPLHRYQEHGQRRNSQRRTDKKRAGTDTIAAVLQRPSGDRGEGSLEVVLVMPVLILLITSVIQFALWSHATHVAVAAAQEGAEQARLEGASAEEGRARAEDFLAQAAPRLITAREVTATRDAQVVTVVVRGRVASVLPGLDLSVRGTATGVVERFRSDSDPVPGSRG